MESHCCGIAKHYFPWPFGVFFRLSVKITRCTPGNVEKIKEYYKIFSKLEFLEQNNISFVTTNVFLTKLYLFMCLLIFLPLILIPCTPLHRLDHIHATKFARVVLDFFFQKTFLIR